MMRKFKIFIDFDKEERWLNHLAAGGHLMRKPGPWYSFQRIEPGSAVVRIDYRSPMSASDFQDYKLLFADAGWQHLAGSRSSGNQYFAAASDAEESQIFSDGASKANRYMRATRTSATLSLPFLLIVFVLAATGSLGVAASPSSWFLTPGLWDREGTALLGGVLIETPFVLMRIGGPILLVASALTMLGLIGYQLLLYRRAVQDKVEA